MKRVTLNRALLVLLGAALIAGLVPAGILLDRRLAAVLEDRVRGELRLTPALLADRESMRSEALAMKAKDLASTAGLAEALVAGDRSAARRVVDAAAERFAAEVFLLGPDAEPWSGPSLPRVVEAARTSGMAPTVVSQDTVLWTVALAPVEREGERVGVAGLLKPVDEGFAGTLAGLTRSEVVIVGPAGVVASTAAPQATAAIVGTDGPGSEVGAVQELQLADERRYLVAVAELGTEATVVFARDLDQELAVLPELRRIAALSGVGALIVTLLASAALAAFLTRPVRSLSTAADRLASGDFEAPVERSSIREIDRLGQAFDAMRGALAARLEELEAANRELADRQERLRALQAELIQRDRLAAAGRLVTELAHEIRNPVANVRNSLEVVRRRLADDPRGLEFVELAIEELLRMHELAEGMLDLNRPRDTQAAGCDAATVAGEVAKLVRAGAGDDLEIHVRASEPVRADIDPDALKQVILNLVQNAREACQDEGHLEIEVRAESGRAVVEVLDDGPGIDPDLLDRIFDPFVTTKSEVRGVGLGLFVAAGIVSRYEGRIEAANRDGAAGARLRIELPLSADRAESAGGGGESD